LIDCQNHELWIPEQIMLRPNLTKCRKTGMEMTTIRAFGQPCYKVFAYKHTD